MTQKTTLFINPQDKYQQLMADIQGSPIGKDYVIYYDGYLGQGAYGIIYKGFSKSRNCIVAIKKLKNDAHQVWKTNPALKREVEVMNKIKHKNVLRLFDVLEEPNGIYIITEYCDGGDLKKLMNKTKAKQVAEGKSDPNRGSLSEGLIFDIFCQIVSGMTEVNKQLCFHRDLKPENIMINQDGTVKIADFGLAREIIGNDVFKLEKFSAKGTPIYAAPNVIRGQKFSVLCDVWSLGLLIYELLAGKNYFEAATNMYTLQGLQEQLVNKPMKIPQHFNKFFLDILPKMVTFSEDNRINFFKLNEMLEKEKFDIIKSIDPNYKLNSGPSPSMGPSMGPTIPSFQGNTYATDVKGMGHSVPTAKRMNQKQQEQENYHLMLELFRYTDFAYNRSRLMIDLMNRLNSTTNYPLSNGCKYTLIFLQTSIFLATIDQLVKYLRSSVITLPSGKVINKNELDPKSSASLNQYIEQYVTKLINERTSFNGMLQQIASKLLSQQYKTRFPNIYANYPQIFRALEQQINLNKSETMDFYELNYRNFLAAECRIKEDETNEVILRIFHMCIVLARVRELIPDSLYNDKDTINKEREQLDKCDKSILVKNIARYKYW